MDLVLRACSFVAMITASVMSFSLASYWWDFSISLLLFVGGTCGSIIMGALALLLSLVSAA